MRQITNHILMVKPTGFNYNADTDRSNNFWPIYSEEEPTFNIPEELLTSLFKVTFDEVFVVIRELELYKTSSIFMLLHVKFNPDS